MCVCARTRPLTLPACSLTPRVLQNALLLSDSSLHLFLQSHLTSEDIEACVSGQTKYSVEEAIHRFALMNRRFPEEDEKDKRDHEADYDSERWGSPRAQAPTHVCVYRPSHSLPFRVDAILR